MVWGLIGGAAIGAAASLLGGSQEKSAQDKATRLQIEQQKLDRDYQKEFAQSGIQWRTEDARSAGIHPLYSLGANLPTYSPVSSNIQASSGMARGLSRAGQDIGRAVSAAASKPERADQALLALQLERASLENDLLRVNIQKSQIGPAFPSVNPGLGGAMPGQGDMPRVQNDPMGRMVPHARQGQTEPGAVTDRGFLFTGTGWAVVPSLDAKERIEDQIAPETAWAIRNYGAQAGGSPPPFKLPPGAVWHWNYRKQEWQQRAPSRPYRSKRFNTKKSLLKHRPFKTRTRKPAYRGRSFTKGKRRY